MLSLDGLYLYTKSCTDDIVTWWWQYLSDVSWHLSIAIAAYLSTCLFTYTFIKNVNHQAWQLPGPPGRLLLVTAHPDDEVMFFGPLLYLSKFNNTQIYLLCLSIGGNKTRKEELWTCAKRLGIPECNVIILKNSEMPDNPNVQWPENIVSNIILRYIESYKINAVVTFDKHGVSKHKNHVSIYYGIASLCIERKIPTYCKLYILESVNILRKYTQILDLPISLLSSSYWYLITYEQKKCIQDAMTAHKSQFVWFRKLYMIFSRYTLLNTLNELNLLDLELDLQFNDE